MVQSFVKRQKRQNAQASYFVSNIINFCSNKIKKGKIITTKDLLEPLINDKKQPKKLTRNDFIEKFPGLEKQLRKGDKRGNNSRSTS